MMPTDMNTPKETNEKIHMGRNIKRFREMLGLKQEGLIKEMLISSEIDVVLAELHNKILGSGYAKINLV